jgi:hypothetical protein
MGMDRRGFRGSYHGPAQRCGITIRPSSATIDDRPIDVSREGDSIFIDLPARRAEEPCRIVVSAGAG